VKVKELMSEEVVAVEPETTLKDVASLLVEHRISGVPVVDAERKVLGVVSEADIVVKEQAAKPGSRILDWLLGGGFFEPERLSARTAEQAMSSPAVTIGAGKEVFQAARLMTEHGVKRLPVVDDKGALIGIVTRSDLVKAFARSDDELAHEIEEMVRLTLLIEDEALHVHVHDGEVHLSGKLERRSNAELLPRFVARVPGVVDVHSTLRWEWDDGKSSYESDPRIPIPPRTR
jgi:CBS domain-containing protein